MRRLQLPLTFYVAAGSALGAVLRWGAGHWLNSHASIVAMPWNTLGVNVLGSLAIGFYAAMTGPGGRWTASQGERMFIMAGVCGGFTTFSLFTAELVGCVQRHEWGVLVMLASSSIAAWLAGVTCGYGIGRYWSRLAIRRDMHSKDH